MLSSLGFDSYKDFMSTLINFDQKILMLFSFLFGATFTNHFWDDPQQIIFLWVLLIIDLGTGIIKALKNKNFQSSKLPRWAGISFTYCLLLFLSFNLGKYSPVLGFLPNSIYTLFCAVAFVSIIENLNQMGCLNVQVYNWIKKKISQFTK